MSSFMCSFCGSNRLRATLIAREYECVDCNRVTMIDVPTAAATPDLTKIDRPFGLLDEATQKALRECGGPWEIYTEKGDWVSHSPRWTPGMTYRLKPQPPKPRRTRMADLIDKAAAVKIALDLAVGIEKEEAEALGWGGPDPRGYHARGIMLDQAKAFRRLAAAIAALPAQGVRVKSPFHFDRYVNGVLMAEGVTIERESHLADAARVASRIASKGPNGEAPVLVLAALTTEKNDG